MNIEIKQLTPDLLNDYLFFFDNMVFKENPDWSVCYCFSYHFIGTGEQWNKEENRSSVIEFVNANKMTGYLAFSDNKPVGWCNANDRMNYQRLLKYYDLIDSPDDKVCSIVCFLIHPDYRRKGIAQKILEKICLDYSNMDYDYIESYPGVKDTVNCTTFDTQKCTTLRSKMMLNLFRNQKPDHNVQSGYVLYSKNLTQKGL